MKYFSVNSVVNAYSNFQGTLTNKTWGLLCVVKQLNGAIIPGTTYQFDCNRLSNYIESLFCLSDSRKEYIGDKKWYVKFSTQWQSFITKQSKGLPNIYDIIVWAYRKESFPDNLTNDYLLKRFAEDFHFDLKNCESLFSAQERDIEYNESLYNESELLSAINTTLNLNLGENITAESDSVKASVGELSRGPFIQTLYAALDATEYFLISQVNFDEIYPFGKSVYKTESPTDQPLQQIYYGAPGTGKSHTINEITKALSEDNVVRTTFHPDSDYSTFVGTYKPTTKKVAMRDVTGKIIIENGKEVTEDRIVYEFVEQAFLQAYIRAWKLYASAADGTEAQPQYLIIEEINRGNCAQIFGDLFQLLDRGDSGFSEYPIKADNDMQKQLAKAFNGIAISNPDSINQWFEGKNIAQKVLSGEMLLLPKNLYIWATMNTSDQSLFPIDSAFKRRWDWKYVPIADAQKNWTITANGNRYDWWQFLEKINAEIEKSTHSEDKKLGYFFCKAKNGTVDAETFVGKVVFYLWNDVFKDFVDESGDLFKDDEGRLTFDKFYTIGADNKTKVVEAKIERFLQNLGVPPINGDNNDEENDDADGKSQRKETLISIQIPDYPKMESSKSTQFDVFVDALKIIGIDKILPIVDNLKYERLNRPVLSTDKYPEIENNDKGYSYYQVDGLYIIKGCKSYTYIRILEDLNETLNLGLTLETK